MFKLNAEYFSKTKVMITHIHIHLAHWFSKLEHIFPFVFSMWTHKCQKKKSLGFSFPWGYWTRLTNFNVPYCLWSLSHHWSEWSHSDPRYSNLWKSENIGWIEKHNNGCSGYKKKKVISQYAMVYTG